MKLLRKGDLAVSGTGRGRTHVNDVRSVLFHRHAITNERRDIVTVARVVLLGVTLVPGTALVRRAAHIPERVAGSWVGITTAVIVFSSILFVFVIGYL